MTERDDTLLGDLLDGRLPAAEAASADRLLSERTELRQALADYQQLAAGLRNLPRSRLRSDFAQRVLAEAQSRQVESASEPSVRLAASAQRASRAWRGWAGLLVTSAVAAGLLWIVLGMPRWDAWQAGPANPLAPLVRADSRLNYVVAPADGEYFLLVVDVTVSATGRQVGAFRQALVDHGIQLDREVRIGRQAERALLEGRLLETAPNPEGDVADEPDPEVYYVVARGHQLDALIPQLQSRRQHFAQVTMDMAVRPGDVRMFRQLRENADAYLAAQMPSPQPVEGEAPLRKVRAQRLVIPAAFNVSMGRWRGGVAGLAAFPAAPRDPQPGAAGEKPPAAADAAMPQLPAKREAPGAEMELVAEALILVRHQP